MDQESEILVFPSIRISDLERDLAEKRYKLRSSNNKLQLLFQDKIQPANFIREHKGLLIAAFLGLFPFAKVMIGSLSKGGKRGWMWKLIRISGSAIKLTTTVVQAISKFI